MSEIREIVIVMPTYNNCTTLRGVVDAVLGQGFELIVVDDGSTDATREILTAYGRRIQLIRYETNRGKGYALSKGFAAAEKMGARYAITIDSDGQHDASDLKKFVEAIERLPDSMIVGARMLDAPNMPSKNSFANRFSNFWFTLQTGISLPDTQSGFRLYPLRHLRGMKLLTTRYESELELMVRLAWSGVKFRTVPITVYYRDDRVTHFRPTIDFIRISLLNTALTIAAVCYGYPRMLLSRLFTR